MLYSFIFRTAKVVNTMDNIEFKYKGDKAEVLDAGQCKLIQVNGRFIKLVRLGQFNPGVCRNAFVMSKRTSSNVSASGSVCALA